MSTKRILVDQSEWSFPEGDVTGTLDQITSALKDGTVAVLSLIDDSKRPVTVYLNGKTVQTVVVDLDGDPRPSEISG
jgi:hypothetical protein